MAWCVDCYQDGRRTMTRATRELEGEDVCETHYAIRNRDDQELVGATSGNIRAAAETESALGEYVPEPDEDLELDEITPREAVEGKAMATLTDEERANRPKCKACNTPLRSDNTTGLCKTCRIASKKTGAKPGPKGPRKSANKGDMPGRLAGVSVPTGDDQACEEASESVTIELTEKRLDFIWSRLTVREKANLLFPSETTPA